MEGGDREHFLLKSGPMRLAGHHLSQGRREGAGGSWRKSLLRGQPQRPLLPPDKHGAERFESDLMERKEKGFRAFSFISS